MPQVRLRTFDGSRRPGAYREWKKEVLAAKFIYNLADKQLAPLVYLALDAKEGGPREAVEHLDIETEVATDTGLTVIWKLLDQEYEAEAYEKADKALKRWERLRRRAGQSMADYLKDLKKAKRDVELEDPGTQFSSVSFAQRMLRRSGLTQEEQRQTLASAGAVWDATRIEAALKLLYCDAHLEDSKKRTFLKAAANKNATNKHGRRQEWKHFPAKTGGRKGRGKGKDAYAVDAADDELEEGALSEECYEDSEPELDYETFAVDGEDGHGEGEHEHEHEDEDGTED